MLRIVPLFLLSLMLLCVFAFAEQAPDPEKGKILGRRCTNCHKNELNGEDAQEILEELLNYKTGEREHRTMSRVVQDYSEQDLADIAAYYAGLE